MTDAACDRHSDGSTATRTLPESDKELTTAERQSGDEMGYWIALVYAARHDSDRAFAWLDRAFNAYGEGITWIKGDPLLGSLVDDPRYKALLRKMRLPE